MWCNPITVVNRKRTRGSHLGRATRFFKINAFTGWRPAAMQSNNGLATSLYESRKSVPEIFGESCGTKPVVSGPAAVADTDGRVKISCPDIRQDDIVPVASEKLLLPRARRPVPLPRRKRASRAVPLCDARTQWRGPRKIIRRPCDPNTYLSLSLLLRHYRRYYRYI